MHVVEYAMPVHIQPIHFKHFSFRLPNFDILFMYSHTIIQYTIYIRLYWWQILFFYNFERDWTKPFGNISLFYTDIAISSWLFKTFTAFWILNRPYSSLNKRKCIENGTKIHLKLVKKRWDIVIKTNQITIPYHL